MNDTHVKHLERRIYLKKTQDEQNIAHTLTFRRKLHRIHNYSRTRLFLCRVGTGDTRLGRRRSESLFYSPWYRVTSALLKSSVVPAVS